MGGGITLLKINHPMSVMKKWAIGLGMSTALVALSYFMLSPYESGGLAALNPRPAIKDTTLCRVWRWERTLDAYRGGTSLAPESNRPEYLVFKEDGTWEKQSEEYQTRGSWQWNEPRTHLAMVDGARGQKASFREGDFRHRVSKLNSDSLILTWRGRHGDVNELYLAEDLSAMHDPASLRPAFSQ